MKRYPLAKFGVSLRAGLCLLPVILCGCATMELDLPLPQTIATDHSPVPKNVPATEAFALAEAVAKDTPGATVVIGRGNSMLPVYEDRTLLVIKKVPCDQWVPGATVVFIGDSGKPVAHTLVRKAKRGWVAAGVRNRRPDDTRVTEENYIGTAFEAITPMALFADDSTVQPGRDELRGRSLLSALMR